MKYLILLLIILFPKHTIYSQPSGEEIIRSAVRYIGIPYRSGHSNPKTGFDCSGFTKYIYSLSGVVLPRPSKVQFQQGIHIPADSLKVGDLIFFQGRSMTGQVGHVGIFLKYHPNGSFDFIHSCSKGVRIDNSGLSYYRSRYIGAKRIL